MSIDSRSDPDMAVLDELEEVVKASRARGRVRRQPNADAYSGASKEMPHNVSQQAYFEAKQEYLRREADAHCKGAFECSKTIEIELKANSLNIDITGHARTLERDNHSPLPTSINRSRPATTTSVPASTRNHSSPSLTEIVVRFEKALSAHKRTPEYQAAVLAILEKTSELAEEIITPKSIDLVANQGITSVRATIFKVFERTRRLLGRDSEAAILEETSVYFSQLSRVVDLSKSSTVLGRNGANPFIWVKEHINPLLDTDMLRMVGVKADQGKLSIANPKPYFQLQKKLYIRIFNRIHRSE
jgi:hypothetical protein